MSSIPFRIVDLIMKYAGAYSQNKTKEPYLEDIKLIMYPYTNVSEALWSVRFNKMEYKIIGWETWNRMLWGGRFDLVYGLNFRIQLTT
jgi:hypothetical protein